MMKELIYKNDFFKSWIYQRNDTQNFYICISNSLKRLRKSLKTDNLYDALKKSYKIIESYENGFYESPSFKNVANEFLKTMQNQTTKQFYAGRLGAIFFKFFKNKKIDAITARDIFNLQQKRLEKIKANSVNKEMVILKQIFNYAYKMKYLNKIPEIEKLKEEKKRRNAFTNNEIEEIFEIAEKRIAAIKNQKTKFERIILFYYMKFLLETGIREGEALSIKFSGINGDTALLTKSKTKIREIFLNVNSIKIIEDLRNLYLKYNIETNSDSYLFLNFNGKSVKSLKKSFNSLIAETSMKDRLGKNEVTLYSFRHSYITEKIKNKISYNAIKTQCGNSIKMIETNYNHLTIHQVKDELK